MRQLRLENQLTMNRATRFPDILDLNKSLHLARYI